MKRIEQYVDQTGDCGDCRVQGWIIEPDQPMPGRSTRDGNPYYSTYLRATVTRMSDHGDNPTGVAKTYTDTWVSGLDSWDASDTDGVVQYTCQGELTLDEILFTVLGTINPEDKHAAAVSE